MHFRRTISAAVAAAVFLGTVALAQSTQPTTQPGGRQRPVAGSSERPPSLERTMKQMGTILKGIDRQLDDAAQDASTLTMVNALQAATVVAKNIYPDDVGELEGEAKAKAINDYRTRMLRLLRTQLKLEEAILGNNRAGARDALASLNEQQKEGHDAYGVDDKHH